VKHSSENTASHLRRTGSSACCVDDYLSWYYGYIQGEHKVFPLLQTFISRKHVGTLGCTSVRRESAVDNFPKRWCTSTLGFTSSSVFEYNISKQVDRERW